jgi:hypothetical protein
VPFKHLKLTTTNRFGEFITDKDMTGATQACKDAYKAWCQVTAIEPLITCLYLDQGFHQTYIFQAKGIVYKDPEKYAAEKSLADAIAASARSGRQGKRGAGNGFRSRGKNRTGQNRNGAFNSKFGKKAQGGGRGGWQKSRGGKTSNSRGKSTPKKGAGNSEAKA